MLLIEPFRLALSDWYKQNYIPKLDWFTLIAIFKHKKQEMIIRCLKEDFCKTILSIL